VVVRKEYDHSPNLAQTTTQLGIEGMKVDLMKVDLMKS